MDSLYQIKPSKKREVFEFKDYTFNINKFISEKQDELLIKIDELKRVLFNAKPGTGKTTFIFNLIEKILITERRVIFITPRLILQNQFKTDLMLKKNIQVCKIINYDTKDFDISNDKIVVSTDKSFHKIAAQLTSKDIVVVDEAHTIMDFYNKKIKTLDSFNIDFLYTLYELETTLILMTGTVYAALKHLLKLHCINFKSKTNRSNVILSFTKYTIDNIELTQEFAKYCINRYGPSSLNVIYIKNKNKCEDIKIKLIMLGYNAISITSEHKETKEFIEIAETSLIGPSIQFLICTNLLEIGVNINNDNIGEIMMINTYAPKEIVQFTMRFRKKEIKDIVIFNKKLDKINDPENYRNYYIEERNYYRQCFEDLMISIESFYDSAGLSFNDNFFKSDVGTRTETMKNIISRFLIQEVYYIESINKSYGNLNELSKILKRHGLKVLKKNGKHIPSQHPLKSNRNLLTEKKIKRTECTNLFLNDPSQFEAESALYASKTLDYKYKNKFNEVKDFFSVDISLFDNHVFKPHFVEPICRQEVLFPYLELIGTFHDCKTTLKFIRDFEPNKRNNVLGVLENFNMIECFFDLSNINIEGKLILKKGIPLPNNNQFIKLKEVASFLLGHVQKNHLIKPIEIAENIFKKNIYSIGINENKINIIDKNEVLQILKALFMLSKKNTRINGKTESGYIIIDKNNKPYIDSKTNKENFKLSFTLCNRSYILSTYICQNN